MTGCPCLPWGQQDHVRGQRLNYVASVFRRFRALGDEDRLWGASDAMDVVAGLPSLG
jgi:hypothetical protein